MSKRGGVVFTVGRDLFFLPAEVAVQVLPVPELARVPGAPSDVVGVALVTGAMVPVVTLNASFRTGRSRHSEPMIVCLHESERIGLVGLEVRATGTFEVENEDDALFQGEIARRFDVAAVVDGVPKGRWVV